MSGHLDLEQRYRRVLRLLPGYYRDRWEEDMVAAFLDGWLTGDPDEDSVTMEYDRPSRQEIASVAGLAELAGRDPAEFVPNDNLNRIFRAVILATEEAIINALVAADDMTGLDGHRVVAIPHERLRAMLRDYHRLEPGR